MKKNIFTIFMLVAGFTGLLVSPVSAAGGTNCPPGPYGINTCDDTGILFSQREDNTMEIALASVTFLAGLVLLANGAALRKQLDK